MLNTLDHATKALILGDYMVHMNHIKRAYHVFSPMGACDINRHDRQNWRSVQKLSFLKVRDCLMEFIDSSAPNQRPNPMFRSPELEICTKALFSEGERLFDGIH